MSEIIKMNGVPDFSEFDFDEPQDPIEEGKILEPAEDPEIPPVETEATVIEDESEPELELEPETIDDSGEIDPKEYFESMVKIGALNAPEDFDFNEFNEDKAQELLDYDRQIRDEVSKNSILEQIADPRLRELIQYGIEGGSHADAAAYFKAQQEESSEITFKTEEDRASFVKQIYKDKGIGDRRAEMLVTSLIEEGELEAESDKLKEERDQETQTRKAQLAEQANKQRKIEEDRAQEWRTNYYKSLEERKFNQQKRKVIGEQFNNVRFEDGGQMPAWQYKLAMIQQNPDHFISLLETLSYYDPKTGFKDSTKKKEKTEETKGIFDKISGTRRLKSQSSKERGPKPLSNPLDSRVSTL